ncbi:MAG TPA: HAD-IIIC family phosphatase [Stellaceae bacterium]|nr:HAD-IIIC family phosphatase [Stellaceae bacterium]
MTGNNLSDLSWLLPPPADFSARCRALGGEGEDLGNRVRALASHALDENQLDRLSKVITQAQIEGRSLAPLTSFRLGVLGNGTWDFIVPALITSAARHGVALECIQGGYDQILQDAQSPTSAINSARPNAVLIAVDYRGLPLHFVPGDPAAADAAIGRSVSFIAAARAGVAENSDAVCIVQTLAPPPEPLFGSLDRAVAGSPRSVIETLNREIVARVQRSPDVLFDVAALAELVGLANWHSPAEWNLAKLPFSSDYLPLYADHVGRILGAMLGKSRRCLVLDLDNTLWGGVIGDDGVTGIKIAQGDPIGEAFLSVQRTALLLRERGVILAVSSKNSDEIARQAFREHPEMLLREEHLAVFQADWTDKATNIKAIAEQLSLGLESLVFLDDNPAERELIRQMHPAVAVPELPADPALYARILCAAGYFEAVAFSGEDRSRADFYRDNARRITLQKQAADLSAYLESLGMKITFHPFDAVGRSRIVQLINKSNQFNLTTRRYTEAEVVAAERDPDCFTLQVRLADIFGDNGMISVVICRRRTVTWYIDTWLMSCRVLGRDVERMVLREILHHAARHGIGKLVGVYRPTDRNKLVKDHYAKLGFTPVTYCDDGSTEWELSTNTEIPPASMVVERAGFANVDSETVAESGVARNAEVSI